MIFARISVLSLFLPFVVQGLDLDVDSTASIKSAAKTLAGGIVAAYNDQSNLIPGLLGEPYHFWESGAVWSALVSYAYLTGDSQYNTLVREALQFQTGLLDAYIPENGTKGFGYDEQSTWALAALTAAEVGLAKPASFEWVDLAKNVFDLQASRLNNETCIGGLRYHMYTFDIAYNYTNTFSNGYFFLLGARLAQFTGNQTYAMVAEGIFDWSKGYGLIGAEWEIYDGADMRDNCTTRNDKRWTSTHAAYLEGASILLNITNGESEKWRDAVSGLVNSVSFFQEEESSILFEAVCEEKGECNTNQLPFKGVAAHWYARVARATPSQSDHIRALLRQSAKGAAESCVGESKDLKCAPSWYRDIDNRTRLADEGISQALAALEVIQALLNPQAGSIRNSNSTTNQTIAPPPGPSSGPENAGAVEKLKIARTAVYVVALLAFVGL